MPRRKKDTIIPLPNELNPQPESKVEIALQKAKEIKKQSIIEEENDDDDTEYTIEPIRIKAPEPIAPTPQPITSQPEPIVTTPQPEPKPKRKYTKRPKPQPEIVEDTIPHSYLFQLETLKKENDLLRKQNNLSHISRLNNMARVMKIKF